MLFAFGRLLIITFISLIGVGLVLFGVRMMGLNNPHVAVDHPLNKEPFFIAAAGGGSEVAPQNTQAAFDHAVKTSRKIWLEADLRLSKDQTWVLFSHDYLEQGSDGKGRVDAHSLKELQALNVGHLFKSPNKTENPYQTNPLRILTVEKFLDRYPASNYIFDLHAKAPGAAEKLVKLIEEHNASHRVIIFSRIPFNTDIMRSEKPLWLYGEPTTNFAKLNLLASLWVETIATIKGDVLFAPLWNDQEPRLRSNLVREFRRRHRLLILEGTKIDSIKNHWIFGEAYGFLTPRPTEAFKAL